MEKKHIREVIVVEGHHDTEKLKKYFDCDTIETGGTSLGNEVYSLIKRAEEKRGVIIFTDPDGAGNRIRNQINRHIPGCKNAFVDYEKAHTAKKVGVEHASYETLLEALEHVMTWSEKPVERMTMQDLYVLGLSGHNDSKERREKIGAYFHIGGGTAKTVLARLNCLSITKEELEEALHEQ